MKRLIPAAALAAGFAWWAPALSAFCGFYVAKADTKLFNKASQVVLVRDGDRTVLTMANDFRGDPKEFAVVVPGADGAAEGSDPRRRQGARRAPRRVLRAAPGRVISTRIRAGLRCTRQSAPDVGGGAASPLDGREPAGGQPWREDRGPVHGRRIRHPHPVGAAERRPRDVAEGERLSHPGRALRACSAATSGRT